jgi:hypothetical protein
MKIWEILKEENRGKKVKDNKNIIYLVDENCVGNCILVKENEFVAPRFTQIEMMNLDFEFIQQLATFEEVLNSDKKCRVEHKLTAEYSNLEGFMYLDILLSFISHYFEDEECKKIFKEAKWYLEP